MKAFPSYIPGAHKQVLDPSVLERRLHMIEQRQALLIGFLLTALDDDTALDLLNRWNAVEWQI